MRCVRGVRLKSGRGLTFLATQQNTGVLSGSRLELYFVSGLHEEMCPYTCVSNTAGLLILVFRARQVVAFWICSTLQILSNI